MILNVICFKNMVVDAFTAPQYIDIEPVKAAVQLARSMKVAPDKATQFQNLTMWNFGEFDDESGKFNLLDEPVLLLDCRTIWKGLQDELLHKTIDTEKSAEAIQG